MDKETHKAGGKKMSNLNVRMLDDHKENLNQAAMRLGFNRLKDGEVRGDTSALITQIAQVIATKTEAEIRAFLYGGSTQQQN